MKTLYLDCGMGAAGDMLTAALLELFDNPLDILHELNHLGIPGVRFLAEKVKKCGITGTQIRVMVGNDEEIEGSSHHSKEHIQHHTHAHPHHAHSDLESINHLISHLHISETVQNHVTAVYNLLAHAESHVHGVQVDQIHFHEVGTIDALADIAAVCYLINKLAPDHICASAVHVGSGHVQCAHGILPVPAPATAHLLKGIPIYGGEIRGELCTPTGAALLKHFVTSFGSMPALATEAIGYGMGKKDFSAANCIRALLGYSDNQDTAISELTCTIDDMTGETIGFAAEHLRKMGALDVFTTPVSMKKNRPGIQFTVLCKKEDTEAIVRQIFLHTTTNGIREKKLNRYVLKSHFETIQTPYGPVRKKISEGFGAEHCKFEYEDLARIALENDLALNQVMPLLHT